MNSKKIILLGCVAVCIFAASTATAQMRGHGSSMGRMGMRGGFTPHSMGRMPMHRGPMMNSPSGFRRFGNRGFNRNDRFRRFNRFNDGRFVRNHRFHRFNRFNHFNNVVFIGDFGFPWWWGWAGATHTGITAATVPVMDTAIAVGLEWLNYRAGSLARAITMAPSTESWDLRLEERFGPTSATMDTQADPVSSR